MKKFLTLLFLPFFFLPSFFILAQPQRLPVTIDADQISFLQLENKVIAQGNVVMEQDQVKIFCDKVIYDSEANQAKIIGEAKIIREGVTAYGSDLIYDFDTLSALAKQMRVSEPPVYGAAARVKEEEQKYILEEGYITTCELDHPHYRLVAKTVTVYPGERIVARNVILKIGDIPVFYFPYFSQNLSDDAFPLEARPGRSGDLGYYVLANWRYNDGNKNRGRVIFDWYEKRGQGMGLSHKTESQNYGNAVLRGYYIRDKLYRIEKQLEFKDRYPSRESENLNPDRYKAQFFYDWRPSDRLSIITELNKFSDKYFMKDFFEPEYDIAPRPRSYFLANYSLGNSRVSLRAQKRVNRFFSENEYLPQLEYSFNRQQLGSSNFYFQSLDKAGSLRKTTADSGETEDAFRVFSDNILSYHNRIAWLSFSPYLGTESAYYSRDRFGKNDLFRSVFKSGITLNTRLYKPLDVSFSVLGQPVEAMRHILTPQVSYKNVGVPNIANSQIIQFDSHDDIKRSQSLTFSLANRLQAKNQERTWDFLYFSPSVEYRLQSGRGGSYFNDVKADLEIYPTQNISFNSDARYSLPNAYFSQVNADLTFSSREKVEIDYQTSIEERPRYRVSLGHRYRRGGSSLGTFNSTYNLTPKLKFKQYIRYEYSTGDLEKQQYNLRFDLHCWWMDIGLDFKRHERGGKDTTLWFAFTLKAFPEINVDFSQTFDGAKSEY